MECNNIAAPSIPPLLKYRLLQDVSVVAYAIIGGSCKPVIGSISCSSLFGNFGIGSG